MKLQVYIILVCIRVNITTSTYKSSLWVDLFIYLFFSRRFQNCTGHMLTDSWEGRGKQYIQLVKVLYCKLPTNGK